MARASGARVRLYFGGRDISADANNFNSSTGCDTEDATTFNSNGYHEFDPTLKMFTTGFDVFYQSGAGTIAAQLDALYGLSEIASLSINEAAAIGDTAILYGAAIIEKVSDAVQCASLIKQTVALKGSGSGGRAGVVQHPLAQETTLVTSTKVDNAAATTNGGRGTFHFTEVTGGACRVVIKHSSDDVTYVTLFDSGSIAAIGAVTSTVTGTVNRYTKSVVTVIGTSVTFFAAMARF